MLVQCESVNRSFGRQRAVQKLTVSFDSGEMVAVLGANGAGKSTLLRLIAGWLPANSGRVTVAGQLMKPSREALRRTVHLIDTPREHHNVAVSLIGQLVCDYQVTREGIPESVAEWFEKLNLVGVYGKKARELSKGQRYKIAMIGLFVIQPKIWLLDEPFSSGLDAGGLQVLREQMRRHAADGGLVIFSSQWPDQAKQLAGRMVVLDEGSVAWDAPTATRPSLSIVEQASPELQAVLRGLGPQ